MEFSYDPTIRETRTPPPGFLHVSGVTVCLVLISGSSSGAGASILKTHSKHLPSAPLRGNLHLTLKNLLSDCSHRPGDARTNEKTSVAELAAQDYERSLRRLGKSGLMSFVPGSSDAGQTTKTGKAPPGENLVLEKIGEIRSSLLENPITPAALAYRPEGGFPVAVTDVCAGEGGLEIWLAAGAGILGGASPRTSLAWYPYEPKDDEQVTNAVRTYFSAFRNRKERIAEGLLRALCLSHEPFFDVEDLKRSIELLSGEPIPSGQALFSQSEVISELIETRRKEYGRNPPGKRREKRPEGPGKRLEKPRSLHVTMPQQETGIITLPPLERVALKYSAIPDLRITALRKEGSWKDDTDHARNQLRFKQALSMEALSVIGALEKSIVIPEGYRPSRNIMTLQWQRRHNAFFIRSYATCDELINEMGLLLSEEDDAATAAQKDDQGENDSSYLFPAGHAHNVKLFIRKAGGKEGAESSLYSEIRLKTLDGANEAIPKEKIAHALVDMIEVSLESYQRHRRTAPPGDDN